MQDLQIESIQCPYCGEQIDLFIDCSITDQEYIEDCSVCCRPITITVNTQFDDEIIIETRTEND